MLTPSPLDPGLESACPNIFILIHVGISSIYNSHNHKGVRDRFYSKIFSKFRTLVHIRVCDRSFSSVFYYQFFTDWSHGPACSNTIMILFSQRSDFGGCVLCFSRVTVIIIFLSRLTTDFLELSGVFSGKGYLLQFKDMA